MIMNAKLSQVKAGDKLMATGFDCIPERAIVTVEAAAYLYGPVAEGPSELFVCCSKGWHFLAGQVDKADNDSLVGFLLPE